MWLLSSTPAATPARAGDGRAADAVNPGLRPRRRRRFPRGIARQCESNLTAVYAGLRSGGSLESTAPPPQTVAWAHELVHRGVQLPALLRAYRLGHGLAERRLEEVASELEIEPEIAWRALARMSHHMFAYVDAICTALVGDYEHERARWIRGAAAARAELATAIIER